MTKRDKEKIKKMPAKEVRQWLINIIDDLRLGHPSVSRPIYQIGWTDGYNSARSKR